jgi:hypothetical protein
VSDLGEIDARAESARLLVKEAAAEAARLVLAEARTTDKGLTERGQRRVNVIWEVTQASIALLVVGATLTLSILMVVRGNYVEASIQLLSSAFFLVIGFYFGRTNHERVGRKR